MGIQWENQYIQWENQYTEFERCVEMPAGGTKLYLARESVEYRTWWFGC